MKTTILTIAILFFGFTTLFATNITSEPLKSTKALSEKVSQSIAYPEFALNNNTECSVWAVIRGESDGSISVLKCDSQNSPMREYVKNELQKMNFASDELESGKEYVIRVDFALIK
jgi:hypothetical protein